MAHDGYARAIFPSHTTGDGDTIFALATGERSGNADVSRIGALAADVMADAIVRAATQATGIPGYPAARDLRVNLHLVVLSAYSLGLIGLGLWIGRRVRGASDFFVAGRALGPGLIFSTMLAANIGAGSTVGATSIGYSAGIAAWWWVGSAAIGSIVLAVWIGPAMRRIAAAHDLRTVGDYLEFRYDATVRGVIAVLLWIGIDLHSRRTARSPSGRF